MEHCSICLSALTSSSHCIRTPCGHVFHRLCIFRMIRVNRGLRIIGRSRPPTCPICRTRISSDMRAFTPIQTNTELPVGEATIRTNIETQSNAGGISVNERQNRNRFSPVRLLRGLVRECQQRRGRRQNYQTGNSSLNDEEANSSINDHERNSSINIQDESSSTEDQARGSLVREDFYTRLRAHMDQLRFNLIQVQNRLGVRIFQLEYRIVGEDSLQSSEVELLALFTGIMLDHRQLYRQHRRIERVFSRQRRSPISRERLMSAWGEKWSHEDQTRFLRTQIQQSVRIVQLRKDLEIQEGSLSVPQIPARRRIVIVILCLAVLSIGSVFILFFN